MGLLFFGALLVAYANCLPEFHTQLTANELDTYFGRDFEGQVPTYELVSPVHIGGDRYRRSGETAKDSLTYNLTAFGRDLTLRLHHNDKLVTPGCMVHYMSSNGTEESQPCLTEENDCYYHGFSLGHQHSVVSVGTCDGLHGLIHLTGGDGDELWIQPVARQHVHRARRSTRTVLPHPHIVYKRSGACTDQRDDCLIYGEYICERPEHEVWARTNCARRCRFCTTGSVHTGNTDHGDGTNDRYATMLVAADPEMHKLHGTGLKNFLLVVFNVAGRILNDDSLGTRVHLAVTEIQILTQPVEGLKITVNPGDTLPSFCQWQERERRRLNKHYDGAAFIVGVNMREQTMVSGQAFRPGFCIPEERCALTETRTLHGSSTIAHELGHNLNIRHGRDVGCPEGMFSWTDRGYKWSRCSREGFRQFLANRTSDCLKDNPWNSGIHTEELPKLPAEYYDGDEQCKQVYGKKFTHCPDCGEISKKCITLKCRELHFSGHQELKMKPLDGTMCSGPDEPRSYCMDGECVRIPYGTHEAQNGRWTPWTRWSSCSRPCGGGVTIRTRTCIDRKFGGSRCHGDTYEAKMCNLQDCRSEENYRDIQCAETNGVPYIPRVNVYPRNYTWRHHPESLYHCDARCQAIEDPTVDRVLMRRPKMNDGTSCYREMSSQYERCVDGDCLEFDCRGKRGSRSHFDKCGVCEGDGTTCRRVHGFYSDRGTYNNVLEVPSGATSLKITDPGPYTQTGIKIEVRVAGSPYFELNNDGLHAFVKVEEYRGVILQYEVVSEIITTLTVRGRLRHRVEFKITERNGYSLPRVEYEYYVPTSRRG